MRTRSLFLAVSLIFLATLGVHADQVNLRNGDRVSGKVKKVDKGTLWVEYFKNTLELPWTEVSTIQTEGTLHLVLKDGQTVVGSVAPTASGQFQITTSNAGVLNIEKDSIEVIRSPEEQVAYDQELERLRNPGLLDLWSGFLDTGLATSQGNADTTTLNVSFNGARTSPRDKIGVNFTSLYSRSDATGVSLTTANTIRGGLHYDVNIGPRLYAFGFSELEYDEFQGLDLRFVPGGGFGYHWVKNDRTRFDVFGGGSLNREFYTGDFDRTSGELVLGEELIHQLLSVTHLEHKLVFYPNLSDTGEYRISLDNAFVTKLSNWLSWQLSLSDRLNSNPLPGKKKNDVLFTTGLRFTFQ